MRAARRATGHRAVGRAGIERRGAAVTGTGAKWAALLVASFVSMAGCASGSGAAGRADLAAVPDSPPDLEMGRQVYSQSCGLCHQANGLGTRGVFPPVVGSEWVTGSVDALIRIVLQGVTGPIEVAGNTYDTFMPGWGDELSDEQVAAVLSYIRQWGPNDAGHVTPRQVAEVRRATADRDRPWTAQELLREGGG